MQQIPHSSDAPSDGFALGRRTVLVGAAWSIPALALATASPAAAASFAGSLRFAVDSVEAPVGQSIPGPGLISLGDDLQPLPGVDFVVQLPAGYTFINRSTTFTGTTSAAATAVLPDILVGPGAQPGTVTATSPTAAPATLQIRALANAFRLVDTGGNSPTIDAETAIPAGSTPLSGYRSWLTPAGALIVEGTQVATGVSTAVGYQYDDSGPIQGATHIAYVDSNGKARVYRNWRNRKPVDTPQSGIPTGSTPLEAWSAWLAPGNDLYQINNLIASGVTKAVAYQQDQQSNGANITHVAFTDAAGEAWVYVDRYDGKPELLRQSAIPTGSTPLTAWNAWLAPNGDLYQTDKVVATGVTYALGYRHDPASKSKNVTYIAYRDAAGNARVYQDKFDGKPVDTAQSMVPPGSQPLRGWSYWLAPDGQLFRSNVKVRDHVTAAAGFQYDPGWSRHSDTNLNFTSLTA